MKFNFKILIFLLVFLDLATAEQAPKNWKFNTGIFFSSNASFRSAKYWDYSYFFPLLSVSYKKIHFRGPNISYISDSPRKTHWYAGFRFFDDDKPFTSSKKENFRNNRASVQLLYAGYKFAINHTAIELKLVKALDRYYQAHSELSFSQGILPFTKVNITIGHGEQRANTYAYGTGAKAGLSDIRLSINSFLPFLPKAGLARISLEYQEVLQAENKNASYILDRDQNWNLFVMAIWQLP